MIHRTSSLIALIALGTASLAIAQTTPPPSTNPGNSSSMPSSSNPNNTNSPAYDSSQSSTTDKAAQQDPKLQSCIASEKSKNTGQSENEIRQKCMLQIASHQQR